MKIKGIELTVLKIWGCSLQKVINREMKHWLLVNSLNVVNLSQQIQKLQFRFIVTRLVQIDMFYIVVKNASFCLHCSIDLSGNSVQKFKSLFVSESWVWLTETSTATMSFLYLLPSVHPPHVDNHWHFIDHLLMSTWTFRDRPLFTNMYLP